MESARRRGAHRALRWQVLGKQEKSCFLAAAGPRGARETHECGLFIGDGSLYIRGGKGEK